MVDDNKVLERIFDKLDTVEEKVTTIQTKVARIEEDINKNTIDLEKHILGVQTNSSRITLEVQARKNQEKIIENQIDIIKSVNIRLKKVENITNFLNISGKILIIAGATGTFITAVLKILGYI